VGIGTKVRSQPRGVKPKMTLRKLRNGVYWQGALKQKDVKQGLRVQRNNYDKPVA